MTASLERTAGGASGFGVVVPVPVYVDDLDGYGMLHHARYPVLLDHALTDYCIDAGWRPGPGTPLAVVRSLTLDYHQPILRPGPVDVRLWVAETGRTSALYRFEVWSSSPDGDVLHVEAARRVVNVDPRTLRPAPFPEDQWRMAEPLLAPGVERKTSART